MNKSYKLVFAILILMSSCGKYPKEVPQKKMNGINGEAVYLFNKDGSIAGVFKEKYNIHDFAVLLVRDTIFLGEDFVSSIHVTEPSYGIEITSPSNEVILGDSTNRGLKGYEFKPAKEGVYDFTGVIKYDTMSAAFEYKFIVVKKD
jgi:hypothetical protein